MRILTLGMLVLMACTNMAIARDWSDDSASMWRTAELTVPADDQSATNLHTAVARLYGPEGGTFEDRLLQLNVPSESLGVGDRVRVYGLKGSPNYFMVTSVAATPEALAATGHYEKTYILIDGNGKVAGTAVAVPAPK